jgi:hypothetical protein
VGLRRLRHAVRGVHAAGAAAHRVRAPRRRGRGPSPHRRRAGGGAALPVGRRRGTRRAARARRWARPAHRRRQPQPLPGPRLQAGQRHQPRSRGPRQGGRAPDRVRGDRERAGLDRAVAVVRRRHQLRRPGRPARAPRAADRVAGARLRGAAGRAGAVARVQALRAGVLRHRPLRLVRGAHRLHAARRAREGARRPRPPPAGRQRRADRHDPRRRGPARGLSLQQPQVRRRRPRRRLDQSLGALPVLRRARRAAPAPDDRPVAQRRGQGRGDDALGRQPPGGPRQGAAGRPRGTGGGPGGRRRARRPRGPARRLPDRRAAAVRQGPRRPRRGRGPGGGWQQRAVAARGSDVAVAGGWGR